MKIQNAIKKLEKTGFKVVQNGHRYSATKENSKDVIEFIKNGGDSEEAICIRIRRKADIDDSQSDYSAGIWCDNILQAIRLSGV